jgi:hypothetical protein
LHTEIGLGVHWQAPKVDDVIHGKLLKSRRRHSWQAPEVKDAIHGKLFTRRATPFMALPRYPLDDGEDRTQACVSLRKESA